MTPKLLVSVRDQQEAAQAVLGQADIIDVKDPFNGPLGYAGPDAIRSVCDNVSSTPVSAALGECSDWLTHEQADRPAVPSELTDRLAFVKLGLANVELSSRTWTDVWDEAMSAAVSTGASKVHPAWVAVAYADHARARCPAPEDVLQAAIERRCSALLVDTFVKDGRTTVDWLENERLSELRGAARDAGLLFALAGQISVGHTPTIRELQPDIVAVRGAVCEDSDRGRGVSADRVVALRRVLCEPSTYSHPGCPNA